MAHSENEGRDLFAKLVKVTERFLDDVMLDFMGSIPYDEYLRKAVKMQRPVVDAYPGSKISSAFKEIAKRADKWPMPSSAAGSLEFFVERLVQSGQLMDGLG
jgi:flagellar biosynthesis protein FlhG